MILTIILIALMPLNSYGTPVGFSGGVNNEFEYEEVVFVTGEPIHFIGKVKKSERENDSEKTIRYTYDLEPKDADLEGELRRTLTVETAFDERNDKGQAIGETTITKYSEDIEIGEDEYELDDFQFSKSDVIDKRPASDFYSGNIKGRKVYLVNEGDDNEGKVIIDISGGNVGYENFWGKTETQAIDYYINTNRKIDGDDISWQGSVNIQVSDSLTKNLKYADNVVNLSSFNGGYAKVTNREIVSEYEYDLPRFDGLEPEKNKRERDDIKLSRKMVPKIERLIVPKFKDVGGHWAQGYIEKLYSLDVFDEESQFFTPDIPMTRSEFTRAIIKACNIRTLLDEENNRRPRRRRNEPQEVSPFNDVPINDKDYAFIKEGLSKGIIKGSPNGLFNPEKSLTRAEAITILIRALGFESKSPTPGYYTSFDDDNAIPNWARDSIYVANEVGIIYGDNANRVNPNEVMTRAQASAMLVRFLEFLEKDLQRDYRENIINY